MKKDIPVIGEGSTLDAPRSESQPKHVPPKSKHRRLRSASKDAERRHLGEWGTHIVWAPPLFQVPALDIYGDVVGLFGHGI